MATVTAAGLGPPRLGYYAFRRAPNCGGQDIYERRAVGIAVSTVLIAIGAVLAWGVTAAVPHANLRVIGIILMAVGAIGLLASIALQVPRGRVRQTRVYSDGMPTAEDEERVYEHREVF